MAMTTRRGLGKGMGCGYKNLVHKDPYVHGLSAKGVKTRDYMKSVIKFEGMASGNPVFDKWKKLPNDYLKDKKKLQKLVVSLEKEEDYLRKRSFESSDPYFRKGINSQRSALWRRIEKVKDKMRDLDSAKLSLKQLAFLKNNYYSLGEQTKVDRIYGATSREYVVKLPQGKFEVEKDYIYGGRGSPTIITVKKI